jgi:hypothetical protein
MSRRLQFTLERLLLRGVHYRLLAAALIVGLVALLAGVVVAAFDPQFDDLGGAVWWAFLRLTDPGYLGDDEGVLGRSVSTVVTVLGYLLFLGLLIAILTQWMNGWIQRVESGISDIRFSGHIIILGWNHRTPNIVAELLKTRARVERFLKAHNASTLRVVVLTERVDLALRDALRAELGDLWDDRRVVLRAGNPLHMESLERVAFRSAASIILPGADFASAQPGVSDAEIVKSLASVSHHMQGAARQPLAVAAIYNSNRRVVAEAAYSGPLAVVEADQLIARLTAQSVLQKGVWNVYSELLTINSGNALFVKVVPAGFSATFGELQAGSGEALLIGVLEGQSGRVGLNPPPDRRVAGGDQLVFIAREYEDCIVRALSDKKPVEVPGTALESIGGRHRILVLGWSRKVPLLVGELLQYDAGLEEIHLAGITPIEERAAAFDGLNMEKVSNLVVNFLDPEVLAGLEPSSYDDVILIARQRLGDEAVADAATLSTYLALEHLAPERRLHRVVEVLDEENWVLFDSEADDVMLSPMVVSFVLAQVALKPELGLVFQELAQPSGANIALCEITTAEPDLPLVFSDVRAEAQKQGYLAIGVHCESVNGGRLLLNPSPDLTWRPIAKDRLVVLTPAND